MFDVRRSGGLGPQRGRHRRDSVLFRLGFTRPVLAGEDTQPMTEEILLCSFLRVERKCCACVGITKAMDKKESERAALFKKIPSLHI